MATSNLVAVFMNPMILPVTSTRKYVAVSFYIRHQAYRCRIRATFNAFTSQQKTTKPQYRRGFPSVFSLEGSQMLGFIDFFWPSFPSRKEFAVVPAQAETQSKPA